MMFSCFCALRVPITSNSEVVLRGFNSTCLATGRKRLNSCEVAKPEKFLIGPTLIARVLIRTWTVCAFRVGLMARLNSLSVPVESERVDVAGAVVAKHKGNIAGV